VRVIFPSLQQLNAIRIPQKAVEELQGKRSVYVVDAEGKAAYREITANIRIGNDWAVESGVQPGELVIVEGTQKIHPGAPVKPVPATADAKGDAKKEAPSAAVPQGAAQKGAAAGAPQESAKKDAAQPQDASKYGK
jgi:membrane fusion protein (multidrug efflux system)